MTHAHIQKQKGVMLRIAQKRKGDHIWFAIK